MDGSIQAMTSTTMKQGLLAYQSKLVSGAAADDATMTKAAKDFEAMFMAQMLQPMMDTVPVDDAFGGGHAEETFRSFLVQEYGKAVANGTDFGLADAVKAEMIRIQSGKKGAGLAHREG